MIEVSENQLKVIKNKFIKDGKSIEQWLIDIAKNIALAEYLYNEKYHNEIFKDVKYKTIEKEIYGSKTKYYLLHDGLNNYNERNENFKKFISNLYKVNKKYPEVTAELEEKFYQLMSEWKMLPGTPTLANASRDLQMLSSCFVLPIEDSIESWTKAIADACITWKHGGGTGFDFSDIRPKNDIVQTTHGTASGPLSPIKMIDTAANEIRQGGMRRAANMATLSVYHPNILDFISMKEVDNTITNFNISVTIDKNFLDAVKNDKEINLINPRTKEKTKSIKAKEIWDKIIFNAWKTGDPGIIFIDRVNESRSNPIPYKETIKAPNPCVSGDTMIPTENGLEKIEDIINKEINIVVDHKYIDLNVSKINKIFKTGIKPLYKITTKSGYEIKATLDHKFQLEDGSWRELFSLKEKDIIRMQNKEGLFSNNYQIPMFNNDNDLPKMWSKELGQIIGWIIGDGWITKNKKTVSLIFNNTNKKDLCNYFINIINKLFNYNSNIYINSTNCPFITYGIRITNFLLNLGVKAEKAQYKEVPKLIFTAPKETIIGFLQALFSADGTINNGIKKGTRYIRLASTSKKLINQVQLLLLNFNIKSRIYFRKRKETYSFEYTTINGELRQYQQKNYFELQVSKNSLPKFLNKIGFLDNVHNNKIKQLSNYEYCKDDFNEEIKSIKYIGEKEVFDLTEPITNSFIGNGFIIHNCNEQSLFSYDSCNLNNINLLKYFDDELDNIDYYKLKNDLKYILKFMDNVIDVNNFPIPEIEARSKSLRRLGIGIMGFAEILIKMKIAYGSKESIKIAEDIIDFIQKNLDIESEILANERGVFPEFKDSIYDQLSEKTPYKDKKLFPRNATRTSIQPTGTTSIIAGLQGAGIEPFFAIVYNRYTAEGIDEIKQGKTPSEQFTFYEVNTLFKEEAIKNNFFGFTEKELYKKISDNGGSVKGIGLPKEIENIYVCAHDLNYKQHIDVQCVFQKYIDNGISKTINFKHDATIKDVEDAYFYAYENGAKGITVFRDGCKSVQVLNTTKKKEEIKTVIKPRKRPQKTIGITERLMTSDGNLYVTVNEDEVGPCEVFIHIGKHGTDIRAWAEAVGRLVSLNLRSGVDINEVAKQLIGITHRPIRNNGKSVLSVPDAIGQILKRINKNPEELKETTVIQTNVLNEFTRPCPNCGSPLVPQEGCEKCMNCEYARCS